MQAGLLNIPSNMSLLDNTPSLTPNNQTSKLGVVLQDPPAINLGAFSPGYSTYSILGPIGNNDNSARVDTWRAGISDSEVSFVSDATSNTTDANVRSKRHKRTASRTPYRQMGAIEEVTPLPPSAAASTVSTATVASTITSVSRRAPISIVPKAPVTPTYADTASLRAIPIIVSPPTVSNATDTPRARSIDMSTNAVHIATDPVDLTPESITDVRVKGLRFPTLLHAIVWAIVGHSRDSTEVSISSIDSDKLHVVLSAYKSTAGDNWMDENVVSVCIVLMFEVVHTHPAFEWGLIKSIGWTFKYNNKDKILGTGRRGSGSNLYGKALLAFRDICNSFGHTGVTMRSYMSALNALYLPRNGSPGSIFNE